MQYTQHCTLQFHSYDTSFSITLGVTVQGMRNCKSVSVLFLKVFRQILEIFRCQINAKFTQIPFIKIHKLQASIRVIVNVSKIVCSSLKKLISSLRAAILTISYCSATGLNDRISILNVLQNFNPTQHSKTALNE